MTQDAFTGVLAAATLAISGESVDKDALAAMLGGPVPTAALRMAVADFVGAIECLVDISANGVDMFSPPATTGASCKCMFSPEYGHPPVQQMTLLMYTTASYGVRMDYPEGLPLKEFVGEVMHRVMRCTDVILNMDRPEPC